MRQSLIALLLVCGCQFHLEGITPPGGAVKPGDPAPGGTTTTPDPGTTNDPTPAPSSDPGAVDMATAPTSTPTPPGPGKPMPDMMPMPLAAHVGDACNNDNDCMETGISCFKSIGSGLGKLNLPGGYCSQTCSSNSPCPSGSECIATLDGTFCLQKCNGMGPNGGCRAGYSCCESVGACGLQAFCGKGDQ